MSILKEFTNVSGGESCLENSFCQKKGSDTDPTATCSRECAIDEFRGLSHFDVTFPELGTESCLGGTTEVSGTCSTGNFVLGDGSCFDGETSKSFVAKCDNTSLNPGECLEMTVEIAGELTGLGKGAAIVVDKESTSCTASCIAGPSCEPCEDEPPPEDEPCLTRTLGFWGTHPHIAERYDPVTVCEHVIDGQSANACSTSEALCTSALDRKGNPNYLQLVAQLTAATLNLNATAELADATCGDFVFNGESIQDIIARCDTEALCGGNKQTISNSGCIEALNAFNNSGDTGFDQTPAPFDKPGPAQVDECQAARGNGKAIGYGLCTQ
jgi:hypothetical protein